MSVGAPDRTAGYVFAERFAVLEQLGAGGMGIVYRVLDQRSGNELALKTMTRDDSEALVRFKDEFRAVSDLRHRNLARLDELIEADGEVFFTMEFVDGIDFLSWVRPPVIDEAAARFTEANLRSGLPQLADALCKLHLANRVHRDVKPANILVTAEGRVVLMDFGLSVRTTEGQQLSDIIAVGTAAYMAPEQASGRAVGPAADWYSVGVLMFVALTGQLPFSGGAMEMIASKLAHEAPSPDQLASGLPPDLVELCTELLRSDPQHRPQGAEILRRLHRDPGGDAGVVAPAQDPLAQFVGRRVELDALKAELDNARRGPVLQLVVAEPGAGKTALVQALARELSAASSDVIVLAGRCHERESLGFKAFDGVVDALSRTLKRLPAAELDAVLPRHFALLAILFPSLGRIDRIAEALAATPSIEDPAEARRRAFTAFRELLVRIAGRSRLLVTIDDFDRSDQESIDLIAFVLAPPDPPHVLFVLTATGRSPALDALTQLAERDLLPQPRILELAPLDAASARELATFALSKEGHVDEARVARIVTDSEGHPGFLLELAKGHAEARDHDTLDEILWSRISSLPAIPRDLLGIMAVASRPMTLAEVAAVLGIAHGMLIGLVEELRAIDLVIATGRWRGSFVAPYHDRVVDAINRRAAPADLHAWHGRLADALDPEVDPERVLMHLLAAGRSDGVGELAAEAARRAAAIYQLGRAARLYRVSLEHTDAADRGLIHAAIGAVLADAGDGAAAAAEYLSAAANAPKTTDLRRRAADQFLVAGEIERALPLLREVLAEVGVPLPRGPRTALLRMAWARVRVRVRLRARRAIGRPPTESEQILLDALWSAGQGLSTIDPLSGAEYQARFLSLALRIGDESRRCHGLALEAAFASTAGETARPRLVALVAEAEQLAISTERPLDQGWVRLARAMAGVLMGDFREAQCAADDALECFAHCSGAIWEQRSSRVFGLVARYFCGDLAELAAGTRAAIREADLQHDRFTLGQVRGGVGNSIWLMDDDPVTAVEEANAGLADWATPNFQMPGYYHMAAITQAHLYAGDGANAYRAVVDTWPSIERALLLRIAFINVDASCLRGRAAVAAGAFDDVHRCASRIRRTAAPWGRPLGRLLDAARSVHLGCRDEAVLELAIAVEELVAHDMKMHAAAARRGLAALTAAPEWVAATEADEHALREAGVRRPDRWLAMLAPGLSPR